MTNNKRVKTIITVLSILLVCTLIALAATLFYNHYMVRKAQEVTIPDHIINTNDNQTEGEENAEGENENTSQEGEEADTGETESDPSKEQTETVTGNEESAQRPTGQPAATAPSATEEDGEDASKEQTPPESDVTDPTEEEEELPKALALQLHEKNPEDNRPFEVENMFPGDSITQYYCVKVSYVDVITMRFRADTRLGYEKLAQVLKCKVVLMNTNQTLYDGSFQNMPKAISYQPPTVASATTAELYYKITVYLDTSVGNEYQNKPLIADFRWWVEETGNLEPPSQTGDGFNTFLWAVLAVTSVSLLVVLKKKRRRM